MQEPLASRHCTPCRGGIEPLGEEAARRLLDALPGWQLVAESKRIERRFTFKTFAPALAFVNAVAAIAEDEGHHPDIAFGWGYALISLQTHAIGGLHENDFIIAAKIDALAGD